MATELPAPESRVESYLAKAAGEDVTIPEKPLSRLEQYLNAIAEGGGGGGGGTSNFNELSNRPKYDNAEMTGSTSIPKVVNTAFTGTDGTAAGTAGLVPAPATTDAGKFLKADGTWDTAGGGGPTVVQTPGNSQTDVMSQYAATNLVYRDPSNLQQIQVGKNASASGTYAISIGGAATSSGASYASGNYSIAIGNGARTSKYQSIVIGYNAQTGPYDASNCISIGSYAYPTKGECVAIGPGLNSSSDRVIINSDRGVAIGYCAKISGTGFHNSVAIGAFSDVTRKGEVSVGCPNGYNYGYNDTRYRVIGGVHDGQEAHDAVTVDQVNSVIDAINTALNVNISHIGANS